MLGADRGRPVPAGPAAWAQALVAVRRVRLEPVRALPAGLLAERRPELLQPRVRGRGSERPPRLALVARVLDVVVGRIDLGRAGDRVGTARVRGAEAARVHVPDVEARRPLDDPLGDELPHPAGAGEAVGAEAGGDPEAAHVRGAEDELPVRRERLRAVDQPDDLHLLERRHAADRVLEQRLEAGPVLLEQLAVEVGRDPVERPRRRIALVAAHHEAAGLGAEVDEERGVAHRRHVERQAARAGDEILVRHRHDRDGDAGEPPELGGEHAAGVDDDLRLDVALVGGDADDAAPLDRDRRHPRVRRDLGAVATRSFGERERELRRVDVAVGGQIRRAEHALGGHRREERLRLGGRDQLQRRARTSSPSRPAARSPRAAPPTMPAAASRPRASRSRARPPSPIVR